MFSYIALHCLILQANATLFAYMGSEQLLFAARPMPMACSRSYDMAITIIANELVAIMQILMSLSYFIGHLAITATATQLFITVGVTSSS